jgi:hypothetical protein
MGDALEDWEGRRVETRLRCRTCDGYDGVLRHRYCKDELELFCDRREIWLGITVTRAEVRTWPHPGEAYSGMRYLEAI